MEELRNIQYDKSQSSESFNQPGNADFILRAKVPKLGGREYINRPTCSLKIEPSASIIKTKNIQLTNQVFFKVLFKFFRNLDALFEKVLLIIHFQIYEN